MIRCSEKSLHMAEKLLEAWSENIFLFYGYTVLIDETTVYSTYKVGFKESTFNKQFIKQTINNCRLSSGCKFQQQKKRLNQFIMT